MLSSLVGFSLLLAPVSVWAQPAVSTHSDWKGFSDEAGGVNFQYPRRWILSELNKYPFASSLTRHSITPRAMVYVGNADSNPYPNTTLVGAEFLYAARPAASIEACSEMIVDREWPDAKLLAPERLNGVIFAHAKSADNWTCHYLREDLYSTYRGGTCYLFDLAVETECFGAVDGMRELTSTERAEVQATLEHILSTVSIREKVTN
jgi:hypothetical protein